MRLLSARSTSRRSEDKNIARSSIRASDAAASYNCSAFLHGEISTAARVLEVWTPREGRYRSRTFTSSKLEISVCSSFHVMILACVVGLRPYIPIKASANLTVIRQRCIITDQRYPL